jgi:MOSC domain-containing protein YiiM
VSGAVHQISVSRGGVPKVAIATGFVDRSGLIDDGHIEAFHGGPDKALCLYSLEVIEGLAAEGHSIAPGSAGENVTVRGVDWTGVVPGSRWLIGKEVEIEVTHFTAPCKKNSRWFSDGDFSRISQQLYPGRSRVYARILMEGVISRGDQFAPED